MFRTDTLRSDLILLLAAIIWGFAFVAQRMGMEDVGPFLFNGIRFALGAGVMLMVIKGREAWGHLGRDAWKSGGKEDEKTGRPQALLAAGLRPPAVNGLLLGLILFAGASFQQVGIVTTTAGNAGFITGLYIILVPVFGMFSGQKASWNLWAGAFLAMTGLYFLSVIPGFQISSGDMLVLLSAVFWAIHVLYTGWLAPRQSALMLAIAQYTVCSVLSLISAFLFETNTLSDIYHARWPILYGGILSVGIAYTLQIVGQKKAPPAHTAIILSLEAVFAVVGGIIILSESMTGRKWIGCALMLFGIVIAQVKGHQPEAGGHKQKL
jgi:drug/metabolite transporter (DMT)-like permease